MHLQADPITDGIGMLKLSGQIKSASHIHPLLEACMQLSRDGAKGIVLDLSNCRNANYAGIAALVELTARLSKVTLAYVGLNPKITRRLQSSELDRGLLLFTSLKEAFEAPEFRAIQFARAQIVIECPNFGNVIRPLLDVLGKPSLVRSLDDLRRRGFEKFLIRSNGNGREIDHSLRNHIKWRDDLWLQNNPKPTIEHAFDLGAILRDLQQRNGTFGTDIIVIRGDHFCTAAIGDMFSQHLAKGADLTLMPKGCPAAFIVKPWVLELLNVPNSMPLCPVQSVQAAQGKVQCFKPKTVYFDLTNWSHYAQLLQQALSGDIEGCSPSGQRIGKNIWSADTTNIARGARITGACYLGAHAKIDRGSELSGTNIIGQRCRVESKTLLHNCILTPETQIPAGVWGENLIMSPHWSINFRHGSSLKKQSNDTTAPNFPSDTRLGGRRYA